MNISGMFHVNVNCSSYEKSREFYAMLGYKVMWEVPEKGSPEVSAAVGMPPYTVRGALLALEGASGPLVDLLEWRDPRDASAPYAHLYHLGIARICFVTKDLDADVKALRRVALFHLDRRVDQLSRRALRSWAPAWPEAVKQTIFSLDQGLVKTQKGGGLQDHSQLAQASGRHRERAESKNHLIPSRQVRTPTPRTLHDQQLMFDGQRFTRHRTNPQDGRAARE